MQAFTRGPGEDNWTHIGTSEPIEIEWSGGLFGPFQLTDDLLDEDEAGCE